MMSDSYARGDVEAILVNMTEALRNRANFLAQAEDIDWREEVKDSVVTMRYAADLMDAVRTTLAKAEPTP